MAEWISVEDGLPKPQMYADYVAVLFATEGGEVCAGYCIPQMKVRAWRSIQGRRYTRKEVTHWMPLPPPPSKARSDSDRATKE